MKPMKAVLLMAAFYLFSFQMPSMGQAKINKSFSPNAKVTQGETWAWQRIGNALGLNNLDNIIIDPEDDRIWYVVSIESGLYITWDSGVHWTHAINAPGLDTEGLQIDPYNPKNVYAGVWDKLYKSEDKGKNWSIIYTSPEYIRSVLVSKIDGSIYLGPQTEMNSTPGIYKSTDGGQHFAALPFGVDTHYLICWDFVEDVANNILYIPVELADHPQPYNPPLFRSLDGGHSWQNIGSPGWHALKMAVDSANGVVYFLKEGGSFYRSSDRGLNWKLLNNQELFYFMLDPHHPGRMFGASSYREGTKGAWMSENSGRAFAPFGLEDMRVTAVAMNGDCSKLFASTLDAGLWTAEVPEYVQSSGIRVANSNDAGLWSLREAMNLANRGVGADTIRFDIAKEDPGYDPSSGTWTILIARNLPGIRDDSLFIDGYSQQESIGEDTNIDGPEIILTTNATDDVSRGLLVSSAYNRISHLVVNAITGPGISISGQSAHHNFVDGCYLGTDASGEIGQANQFGIYLDNSSNNRIGSLKTAERNIISGNSVQGIVLTGPDCSNNLITGNDIGLTPKKQERGNSGNGIFLGADAFENIITENDIAFNSFAGIAVFDEGTSQNTISKNSIYSNLSAGIFIVAGANGGIQPPVLTSEDDVIKGKAAANATIELFSDQDAQGEIFEGAVTADENGYFIWTEKVQGPYVTATATDALGNTSIFSNPVEPPGGGGDGKSFVVTTTSETGPGSITEALSAAHNRTGAKRIEFHIPKSDAGFDSGTGVWTIKTGQVMNITTDSLTLDGRSQAAFIGEDSNPFGPEIMFDGQLMGGNKVPCFSAWPLNEFNVYDVTISRYAVGISLNTVNGGRISGCYFGSDPSGIDSLGNVGHAVYFYKSSNFQIGASDSSAGNLFLGSSETELYISQSSNVSVTGNVIGLNRSKERSFFSYYGAIVIQSSENIEVALNTVGGSGIGLTSWQSARLTVRENLFNVSDSWEKIGNLQTGVWLSDSSHDNLVQDNLIGFCQLHAIGIQDGAVRNHLSRNRLSGNEFAGIYLESNTNNNIAAPTLLVAVPNQVNGQAGAGNTIEVFNDEDGQAREYLGTTTADGSGYFSMSLETTPTLPRVTATATDASGNTSALSAPMEIGETGVANPAMTSERSYYLAQNYPNPFNPDTCINFELPDAKKSQPHVALFIYNMQGQLVRQLVNENKSPGAYSIKWDAKNNSGKKVPSGVYVYTLTATDFKTSRKMLFLN